MKYLFSTDNTNLIITLDTESGKYNPEITTVNDPNITLENDRIWFFENGKYIRNFPFYHIGTISGVTPTSIADAFEKLNVVIDELYLLVSPKFKGSIVPTDLATGTEDAVWIATQAGTYTNFGGVVVSANSRAEISRVNGVFSISQTPIDTTPKYTPWEAKSYTTVNNVVTYLGKDWYNNAVTVFSDIPGTSTKWVERLTAYADKEYVDSVKEIPIKERLVLSKQLIDINDLTTDVIVHNSQTIGTGTSLRSTNFIKVIPNKKYYFRQSSSFRHGIMRYSSNSDISKIGLLSESSSTFGNYVFVMPADTNYVKVGLQGSGETLDPLLFSQFILGEGDFLKITDNIYEGKYINKSLNGLGFSIKTNELQPVVKKEAASFNLLDYYSIIKDIKINSSTNKLDASPGFSVSQLIPCLKNETFTFGGLDDVVTRSIFFYDKNFIIISKLSVISGDIKPFLGSNTLDMHFTFTVPDLDDIVFFRAQVHASDPSYTDKSTKYHIYKDAVYKPFQKYVQSNIIDNINIVTNQKIIQEFVKPLLKKPFNFNDKTFVFFGDSILSQKVWLTYFNSIIRPMECYNESAGGARLVNTNGVVNPSAYQNSGCDNAHRFVAEYNLGNRLAPDYIFIALGTNEFNKTPSTSVLEDDIDNAFTSGGSTLKDLSTVDITKINGALRYMVETLSSKFPLSKFVICTPIPNTLSTWNSQKEVVDSIKWTARRLSIPIIDLHANSNIITLFDYPAGVATYRNLVDGIHPFGTGVTETPATKMIGEQVASQFLNYVM